MRLLTPPFGVSKRSSSFGGQSSPGCLALFFGVFLLFGLGFLGLFGAMAWRDIRVFTAYEETTCVILDKNLKRSTDSDGDTTYAPEFTFRYVVHGRQFTCTGYDSFGGTSSGRRGKEAILARFQVGGSYPCWYDPDNPQRAVLVKRVSPMYLFMLIPLIFVLIGGGGVRRAIKNRGKSPEALSVSPQRTATGVTDFPGSEVLPPIKTEAGQWLSVQLKRETSRGCELGGILFFTLFWNGLVSVFVWHVVQEWRGGNRPIGLTLFLVPFVLVGLAVAVWFVHQLLNFAGTKETVVEIEREPVCPGEAVQFHLCQAGPLSLYSLTAVLKCEEKITYRRGTSTYHDSHTLVEQEVLKVPAATISANTPWQQSVTVEIAEDAMHSFKAPNNEVVWQLVVKGEVERWPDFEHPFPFRVVPTDVRRRLT